ncbi:MAG: MoaD/ThiS family protein [Promethearchaeota archaeon]
MNSETDVTSISSSGNITELQLKETKTVKQLLKELGLLHRHFVVLVDGKRAQLDDVVTEGQRVLVLPIIAGG